MPSVVPTSGGETEATPAREDAGASPVASADRAEQRRRTRMRYGVVTSHLGEVDRKILAAGRQCFIDHGLARTTIAEVARIAGVTRPTVYARFSDVDDLTAEVLTRELVTLLDGIYPLPTTVDDLVDRAVQLAVALRDSELMEALRINDPQILAAYQFRRLGRSQKLVLRLLRNVISHMQLCQHNGEETGIRDGDPRTLALFVLTTVQAFVLSAAAVIPALSDAGDWERELQRLLKGYLES